MDSKPQSIFPGTCWFLILFVQNPSLIHMEHSALDTCPLACSHAGLRGPHAGRSGTGQTYHVFKAVSSLHIEGCAMRCMKNLEIETTKLFLTLDALKHHKHCVFLAK